MPTDLLRQLPEFRVGPQAREGGLASQLDEIGIVFPIGSLQPFERALLVVDCPVYPRNIVWRNMAVTACVEFLHDLLHRDLVSCDTVRLGESGERFGAASGMRHCLAHRIERLVQQVFLQA